MWTDLGQSNLLVPVFFASLLLSLIENNAFALLPPTSILPHDNRQQHVVAESGKSEEEMILIALQKQLLTPRKTPSTNMV